VQALVMRDGMRFVIAGALVGTLGALAATRFIRSMLFETTSFDLATFITVPLLLAAAALGASYLSARRAARTDPLLAIRGE
jgi:putative ABC transport system permease protein